MTWSERVARMPEVVLVIVAVLASMTVAGAATPCVFPPPHQPVVPPPWMPYAQCVSQVMLLNGLPILVALLAASSSRWHAGVHLLAVGVVGMVIGTTATLTSGRFPLLALPLLTSALVILALRAETIIRRAAMRLRQDFV
jgi:hypothetical protein